MKYNRKIKFKKAMWIVLSVIALIAVAVLIFINQPNFGKTPQGERKERVLKSPNYRDGKFQNLHDTPQITSGKSYLATM